MSEDAAIGALIGACVGDAAGSALEFCGPAISEQMLQSALDMRGGGCWKTQPGQVTDDGELTVSLAHALLDADTDANGARIHPAERAAKWYKKWIDTDPADVGVTTRTAFRAPRRYDSLSRTMQEVAAEQSIMSKANGSMMRATPLAIWGHRLPPDELAHLASADSRLSHPNPAVVSAVEAYVIAIASFINTPRDRARAWQAVQLYSTSKWCDPETRSWIAQASAKTLEPARPNIGFVKIAFVNAFCHLLNGSDYLTTIRETLRAGGDTDTNACIAGGLIGAADGIQGIPPRMSEAVANCKCGRPAWLSTKHLNELAKKLMRSAPKCL